MLFVDSAFNTVIPDRLVTKLLDLGLSRPKCYWIRDFLTNHRQMVRLGPHTSSTLTLNTSTPQGCLLNPLLYPLYTHDCIPSHTTNNIIKFADDTIVVGFISRGDKTADRDDVQKLAM